MKKKGFQQRKLSNVKLTERYRFQYLGLWMLVCILLIGLLDVAVVLLYDQMWANLPPQGADLAAEAAFRRAGMLATVLMITAMFGIAVVSLAIFTAHRIGGPYLAIKRTAAAIQAGDLGRRLKFRDYDKLDDIESAFNEMMDAVQKASEASPARPSPLLEVTRT